jgi:hypothetical protein
MFADFDPNGCMYCKRHRNCKLQDAVLEQYSGYSRHVLPGIYVYICDCGSELTSGHRRNVLPCTYNIYIYTLRIYLHTYTYISDQAQETGTDVCKSVFLHACIHTYTYIHEYGHSRTLLFWQVCQPGASQVVCETPFPPFLGSVPRSMQHTFSLDLNRLDQVCMCPLRMDICHTIHAQRSRCSDGLHVCKACKALIVADLGGAQKVFRTFQRCIKYVRPFEHLLCASARF